MCVLHIVCGLLSIWKFQLCSIYKQCIDTFYFFVRGIHQSISYLAPGTSHTIIYATTAVYAYSNTHKFNGPPFWAVLCVSVLVCVLNIYYMGYHIIMTVTASRHLPVEIQNASELCGVSAVRILQAHNTNFVVTNQIYSTYNTNSTVRRINNTSYVCSKGPHKQKRGTTKPKTKT